MTTTLSIPAALSEIATFGQATYPIAFANEVIEASGGTITWATAGNTWATLCKGTPGTEYPSLLGNGGERRFSRSAAKA